MGSLIDDKHKKIIIIIVAYIAARSKKHSEGVNLGSEKLYFHTKNDQWIRTATLLWLTRLDMD